MLHLIKSFFSKQKPTQKLESVDLNSPRAIAAVKIAQSINKSHNRAQLDNTAKMIDLFEKKYDDQLPLRFWWRCKSFDLSFYPPNK